MTRYWASYGRSGFLGSFEADTAYARGAMVEVQSPRGREVATILNAVDERFTSGIISDGYILQLTHTIPDDTSEMLSVATESAATLPLLVADAERLLDGKLILHVMLWDDTVLTDWVNELSRKFACDVRLLNLKTLPKENRTKGCGEPDCGEGNCGSGCDTCSKGSVRNAEELTEYFLNLRKQMDAGRKGLV